MQTENFRDKYEKSGRIGGALIRRFYAVIGELVRKVAPTPAVAFEVGAGEGYSTSYLRRSLPSGCAFESSEFDPALAERARARNPDIPFTVQSIYQLARPDRSADLVFCLEVMEHLQDPDRALDELARIARRAVILSVPNEPLWRVLNCARGRYLSAFGNTPGHIQHWTPRAFERFVARRFTILARAQPLPWTAVLAEPRS